MKEKYLKRNKDGIYHYNRWVPKRFLSYVDQSYVYRSTGERDFSKAVPIKRQMNEETERLWRALEAGEGAAALDRYEKAVSLARDLGHDYKPSGKLAEASLADVVSRVQTLESKNLEHNKVAVAALLGGHNGPGIHLSNLFDTYQGLVETELTGKSDSQKRKWTNQRKNAIANFLAVVGEDKLLENITNEDVLEFRQWWADRVIHEGLTRGAANKNIGQLNKMLKEVGMKYKLPTDKLFANMRLKGTDETKRAVFTREFVQDRILADGALDHLNNEARAAVYIVVACGMRPSEIVNLSPERHVHLGAKLPFVEIRPDGRDIKSQSSKRDMPMVGLARLAWKLVPDGFPRYRHKEDHLSNLVNKVFLNAGLRPTREHTFYSLRHTFQDLLTDAECPDRIAKDLMGHALDGERYGNGARLAKKAEWLEKIAYEPPASLIAL